MRISRCALLLRVSVVAMCLPLAPCAFGQIQSTISCPAENGYWDVLSVMMMDPGLASNYHMEGITGGLPSSYVYTMWDSEPGQGVLRQESTRQSLGHQSLRLKLRLPMDH